jgi:hypothetical protein
MEGSPTLISRTASLIPVRTSPFERDLLQAQAARISAQFFDKTEAKAPLANVKERVQQLTTIKQLSLFPNDKNLKFRTKYSDATS